MRCERAVIGLLLFATVSKPRATLGQGPSYIDYTVTTEITGIAPSSLQTRIMIHNRGKSVLHLEFGDCPIMLRGFRSAAITEDPVWRTELSGPPFMKSVGFACTLRLNIRDIEPRDSFPLVTSIPTYEILGDTLSEGRYYFTAVLTLNSRTITLDAGSAVISRKQQSIPASRMIDGIRYSASLKRIKSKGPEPDWLEFAVTVRNTGTTVRHIEMYDRRGCVIIVGYATPERRDSHYMRSAREDRDGIVRTCPITIPEMRLARGQSLTFRGQMLAPDQRRYYLLLIDILDHDHYSREPIDISLAADERR